MAWSHSPWLVSISVSTALLFLAACGPDVDEGSSDESGTDTAAQDLQCSPGDPPPPCVGLTAEGCLSEPAGDATCSSGEWTCDGSFTAPKLDPEASCTVPPAGDCEGDRPGCTTQSEHGQCADAEWSAFSFCIDGEWACPPGFNFDHEIECEWGESEGGA